MTLYKVRKEAWTPQDFALYAADSPEAAIALTEQDTFEEYEADYGHDHEPFIAEELLTPDPDLAVTHYCSGFDQFGDPILGEVPAEHYLPGVRENLQAFSMLGF